MKCHQRDDIKVYILNGDSPRLPECWQPDLYPQQVTKKDSSLETLTGLSRRIRFLN